MPLAYVGFTPYHVLLALALEDDRDDQEGGDKSILFLADEAGFVERYPELGDRISRVLRIVPLPTISRSRIPLAQRIVRAQGYREIFSTLHRQKQLTVRVFNGLRLEAEHAARYVGGAGSLDFVEDGLDAYFSINTHRLSPTERLVRLPRDRLRPRVEADSITWLPFQRFYVLEPRLFRGPHDDRVHQIDPDSFRRVLADLQDHVHLDVPLASVQAVLLLDHSEQIPDVAAYTSMVGEWRKEHADLGCAIKAHPRERSRELLDGIADLDAVILPAPLPAELCTAYLRADCEISCGLTTFVLSSRLLLPERSVRLSPSVPAERRAVLMGFDPAIS